MRVRRKHWSVASPTSPEVGPDHTPGVCPGWGWNRWPFPLQDSTQETEPHWSGQYWWSFKALNLLKRFYLFIFREGKGGRKRGRETSMWEITSITCLSHNAHPHTPNPGCDLQLRHVSWLGIELQTFRFGAWCSIHWDTLARAIIFKNNLVITYNLCRLYLVSLVLLITFSFGWF